MDANNKRRGFSIEIESKIHVKNVSISNEAHERVLFEGYIGELVELSMVDGEVLEVRGVHGTLRLDLRREELAGMLARPDAVDLSSEMGSYTSTKKGDE
jgi:hypothetical protein